MELEGSLIETGVDKLVRIVKERGKIALADAAKELGVSTSVIQEWVDFLEEEGIISVEYSLTKPFLVERKLSKKEVDQKSKEFAGKKDAFIRKAEVSLSFLQKQAEELKGVKSEFDRIKNDLGLNLDTVRSELRELEKFQQSKQQMQKQIEEQRQDTKSRMEELSKKIIDEQKRYQELVEDVNKEKIELEKEKVEASSIEGSEALLNGKLKELKSLIGEIEKKVSGEDSAIKNSEAHIERLNRMLEGIKMHIEQEKAEIPPLIEKSKEQEKKMIALQSEIVSKIAQNQKSGEDAREATKKVNEFFEKKLEVVDMIDRVNQDRDELEKNLIGLIKKAKSFQLTAKSGDVGSEMIELEKKFIEVDKSKSFFEAELKKLASFFRI